MRHRHSGIGPFSFSAFNVSWAEKNNIMWEAFNIIKGVWDNPRFSYEGKYFNCKDVEVSIPLIQRPHPPLRKLYSPSGLIAFSASSPLEP